MFAQIDIRKSALTLLAAAALSLAGGLVSSVQASPLAAACHGAAGSVGDDHLRDPAARNQHRLARPANRFNGFVGAPDQGAITAQGR